MKNIMTFTFMALVIFGVTFSHSAQAIDQETIDGIKSQGLQVKMGELTGAGSKISLRHMVGLILPEGVIMKKDCSAIIVKKSPEPKVSDIIKIKIEDHEIVASEFIGFVSE